MTALTSAVLCGEKIGRKAAARMGANRCVRKPDIGSGGPTIDRTSGRTASSVENVRVNWSSSDLRGSTLVGDRHASRADLVGSADRLSVCFFLPTLTGVLLATRNNLWRRSAVSFSPRGGLFVLPGLLVIGESELGASGSVWAFSLPELSFRQSPPLSAFFVSKKNK